MKDQKSAEIIQIIRLKTNLPEEELLKIAREREPQFKALPGLLQKYYIRLDKPGEYGGIYIWDSAESMKKYKASELAATIPKAYQVMEAPAIETVNVLFQLRD